MNANPKASTVRAGCGVRMVTGRKYARRETGARSPPRSAASREKVRYRSAAFRPLPSCGRRGLDNRGAKEEVEANIRSVASQDSCTKYSQAGNKGDCDQSFDLALKRFKKLECGVTKIISN